MCRLGQHRPDLVRNGLAVELVGLDAGAARSRSNLSGERVVPATKASPGDQPGKGAAGIAGAENEEARASCRRSVCRPAGQWPDAIRRARRASASIGTCCSASASKALSGNSRDSAQTAAPRTSGDGSSSSRATSGSKRGIAGIAGGDQHVAHEAVAADALDRRAREQRPEAGIVERQQVGQRRRSQIVAGGELRLRCGLRELVPRADREAVVAAIDAIADRRAEFVRDRPLVLDGEIGDAAPRIEPVGRGKGVGRADVEAGAARAAMVVLGARRRRVRRW